VAKALGPQPAPKGAALLGVFCIWASLSSFLWNAALKVMKPLIECNPNHFIELETKGFKSLSDSPRHSVSWLPGLFIPSRPCCPGWEQPAIDDNTSVTHFFNGSSSQILVAKNVSSKRNQSFYPCHMAQFGKVLVWCVDSHGWQESLSYLPRSPFPTSTGEQLLHLVNFAPPSGQRPHLLSLWPPSCRHIHRVPMNDSKTSPVSTHQHPF
jgi:hypothetical protein